MVRNARVWAFVAGLVLLLAGCHTVPLTPKLDLAQELTGPAIAVDYEYPAGFVEYEYVDWTMGDRWSFALGRATVDVFDQAARALAGEGPPVLTLTLAAELEDFTWTAPLIKTGEYTATLRYRLTVRHEGQALTAWQVIGRGKCNGQAGFEFARWPGQATDQALEDAAQRLVTELPELAEVKALLPQPPAGVK